MGNVTHILPVLQWLEVVIAFVSNYYYELLRLLRVATVNSCTRGVNGKDKHNTEHKLERHSQERIPLPKPKNLKFKKLILEKLKHPLQ